MSYVVPKYAHRLQEAQRALIQRAGDALVTVMRIIAEYGHGVMPPAKNQEFVEAVAEHIAS
eukprot:8142413-Pyramimonas_sp.AAC.1